MMHLTLHDTDTVRTELKRFKEALVPLGLSIVNSIEHKDASTLEIIIQRSHKTNPSIIMTLAADWFKDDLVTFRIEYKQ
ncbi:MAG: hypothetical protein AB1489_11995 [Acidobacteriota bacterium]